MTLWLIRHAVAGVRNNADPNDDQRPLDEIGRDQAQAIVAALDGASIGSVHSSPALRCLQTVAPLAADHGLVVEHAPALFEASSTSRSLEFVRSFTGHDAVLCSHGDVIPDVMRALEVGGTRLHGRGCAKGSIWKLDNSTERIESAEYLGVPYG